MPAFKDAAPCYTMGMRPRRIESARNPAVAEALSLIRKGKGTVLIEGPHLMEAALGAEGRVALKEVFFTDSFEGKHRPLYKRIAASGALLLESSEQVIRRLSDTETPQGVLALGTIKEPDAGALDLGGIVVVADGVQDPGNMGSMVRTAEAAGARAVFYTGGSCDPFSHKALRASAGSAFTVPVVGIKRNRLVQILKERGVRIAVTRADAEDSLFEADMRPPVALVFGNEAAGVSAELGRAADLTVRIPILGRAESLNVAASAAVFIYEAVRNSLSGG